MRSETTSFEHLILMKVGFHGVESLERIIDRKLREQDELGFCYWGYGGSLCHPVKAIRPYVAQVATSGAPIDVAFLATPSPFHAESEFPANEYSLDGASWSALHPAVSVFASTSALVLKSLRRQSLTLDISQYRVAFGPSKGRLATEYLRYRVDKALLRREPSVLPPFEVKVAFTAQLADPYATLVRLR